VVEMMLDATQNNDKTLSDERLLGWHAALFLTDRAMNLRLPTVFRTLPFIIARPFFLPEPTILKTKYW